MRYLRLGNEGLACKDWVLALDLAPGGIPRDEEWLEICRCLCNILPHSALKTAGVLRQKIIQERLQAGYDATNSFVDLPKFVSQMRRAHRNDRVLE